MTTPRTYDYCCILHPYMRGQIIVVPAAGSTGQGTQGYGDFTVVLTGKEIYAMSASALIVLVGLMIVFARSGRKGS